MWHKKRVFPMEVLLARLKSQGFRIEHGDKLVWVLDGSGEVVGYVEENPVSFFCITEETKDSPVKEILDIIEALKAGEGLLISSANSSQCQERTITTEREKRKAS